MEAERGQLSRPGDEGYILEAVAQAKGQRAADRIEHLKKGDMAKEAETLLADTAWLPRAVARARQDIA